MERMLREQFQVEFVYMSGINVKDIDLARSRKLNTRTEPINEAQKEKYIAAMERGDMFPPVLLWKANNGRAAKYSVADGVHRIAAHEALGRAVDAYIIDPATPPNTINMIAFACNPRNGLPNSEAELISHAIYYVDSGVTHRDAAAQMGIKLNKLTAALNVREADGRASECGVNMRIWESIGPTSRAALNRIRTNDVLKKAAALVSDARLTVTEVNKLVAEINNQTREPAKQLKFVEAQRKVLKDRIDANAGKLVSGRGPSTPKQRWAIARGNFLTLPDDPKAVAALYVGDERDEVAEEFGSLGRRFLEIEKELLNG